MLLVTLLIGLLISAAGYVPPGNINLTLARLTVTRGMRQAWGFILAFSIVEMFFTFGMMRFARWLASDVDIDEVRVGEFDLGTVIDFFMALLLLVMGTITWLNRNKVYQPKDSEDSRKGSVLYGVILGIINPVQIPFWLFCGNYVILHEWITTDYPSLIAFSIGSGIGAGAVLYGFAYFAQYIQEKFALSGKLINKGIAYFLFTLSFYMTVKLILQFI
jgi:threonine/homoserine/homoserine lactone efflux protein